MWTYSVLESFIDVLIEMLDKKQEDCKSKIMVDATKDRPISNERATMFSDEITEGDEFGSFFSASEEEVIEVQHLLAEPECNKDLVDSILGFNVFNPQKCFNFKDYSCDTEKDHAKLDGGAQDSVLTRRNKTKLEFIDGLMQVTDEEVLHATNTLPVLCEDYFLDDGYMQGYSHEQFGPESQCIGLYRRNSGAMSELSAACTPMLESTYNQNSFLLDKMTIHELLEAFRNMFGRETLVKDKQWLKHRILFGLQNLVKLEKDSNLLDHGFTSNKNESKLIFSPSNDLPERASSSCTGVLNNITTLGDRYGKRERLAGCDSMETLSSEVNTTRFALRDSKEKERSFITKRRLRKPTQRYVEESLEQQSKRHNKKCGVSYKNSRDKFLLLRAHNQPSKMENGSTPMIDREESFREAIQVPFGIPRQEEQSKQSTSFPGHKSEDFKDRRGYVSNENNDMEPFLGESQDEMSEDDCIMGMGKGGMQRKQRKYWSVSEMMKLIEGVSQCGVGKWSEIKNLLFSSASHRTSVDLKDKWRNLLRASCTRAHSNRKVNQGRKHAPRQMQSILRRVRELDVLHPYAREFNFEDSFTSPIAPHTPASTSERSMPFSTAVRG